LAQAATFRLNPAVAIEDFGQESLVLDCEELRLFELNATARAIVAGVGSGLPLAAIATCLAREYGQPEVDMQADIAAAVERMVALRILEPRGQE